MPNYCSNTIEVEGNKETIEKMLAFVKTNRSDFDFSAVIPYPEEWEKMDTAQEEWYKLPKETRGEMPKAGFNCGGYDWCIKNWGTKWWTDEVTMSVPTGTGITIYFDTAWSPSTPVTEALSKLFPDLEFTHYYQEEGCDFSGYDTFKNGENIDNARGSAYAIEFDGSYSRSDDDEDEE